MRKEAGAASLSESDLQEVAQDGTITIAHDSANADAAAALNLGPKKYAPRRRAPSEMQRDQAKQQSFDEVLPLFLDTGRQETGHEAGVTQAEHEIWDESSAGTGSDYPSLRSADPEVLEQLTGLSNRSVFAAFIVPVGVVALLAAAAAGVLLFRPDLTKTPAPPITEAQPQLGTSVGGKNTSTDQDSSTAFGSRFEGQAPTHVEPPRVAAPKLVANANDGLPRGPGEAFPLGISVDGAVKDVSLAVRGLSSGTTLSAGRMAGNDEWVLTASELDNVLIQPPRNFTGTMDLTVELRTAGDTVGDRRSLRFQWAEPAVADMMATGATIHHIDPGELSSLLKRGDALLASGDVAAARLVLRRAAEAGNARAAMTLAGTYDSAVLAKLGVHGVVPDMDMARAWYEKAKQFGSPEASRRLETLANKRQ